ncbi:MAG TPA: hypothetical protein VFX49_11675 [Chloroflexota bacterium]|nr:hypothetical protein [Chloroflexota bacterium]
MHDPGAIELSGGMCEVQLGAGPIKNKLLRATALDPTQLAIQLRAEMISSTFNDGSLPSPIAEISWQAASGLHTAIVDVGVGAGTTLCLTAAEVVDITILFPSVLIFSKIGVANVAPTETNRFRIFGTCAPGTASSRNAFLTQAIVVPAAGVDSQTIPVPTWAKKLWTSELAAGADIGAPTSVAGPNLRIGFQGGTAAASAVVSQQPWISGQPAIVPGWATGVCFDNPALAADANMLLLWELEI